MYKKLLLLIGVFLLLLSIVLYFLIHGIDKLYIFELYPRLEFISDFRNYFLEKTGINFKKEIIRSYLVDFLWFISLNCVLSYYYSNKKMYKYILVFLVGFISEISQLIYPQLGTFDFIDLCIYFLLTLCFAIFELSYYKIISNKFEKLKI